MREVGKIPNTQQKWNLQLYRKANGTIPVKEFLESLSNKLQAKALRDIELLEKYGTNLREPHVKSIIGSEYSGICELKIRFSNDKLQ